MYKQFVSFLFHTLFPKIIKKTVKKFSSPPAPTWRRACPRITVRSIGCHFVHDVTPYMSSIASLSLKPFIVSVPAGTNQQHFCSVPSFYVYTPCILTVTQHRLLLAPCFLHVKSDRKNGQHIHNRTSEHQI